MPVWRPPTGTRGSLETTWRGRLRRSTRTSLVHGASTPNRSKITETALIRAYEVERTTGIEPAFSAWEADVLPLNYIRLARRSRSRGVASGVEATASRVGATSRSRAGPALLRHVLLDLGEPDLGVAIRGRPPVSAWAE